jgi:predicted phosphodiesterase
MKLRILSDLHNEFLRQPRAMPRVADADVVVLGGDIDVGTRGLEWARRTFGCRIVYVPGNHEYYGLDFDETRERLQKTAALLGIDLLDPGIVEIDGVVFIGATLWTDFALFGDRTREMLVAMNSLTDFSVIRWLSPARALARHDEERAFIARHLAATRGKRRVVVTHHLPSRRSVAERYREDRLAAAFASDLDSVIEREQPALWVHGHTHDSCDYRIGETQVVCNPAGYPGREENAQFSDLLTVEI